MFPLLVQHFLTHIGDNKKGERRGIESRVAGFLRVGFRGFGIYGIGVSGGWAFRGGWGFWVWRFRGVGGGDFTLHLVFLDTSM